MKLRIKTPSELEKELLKIVNNISNPVIFFDTGGLIDLVESFRQDSIKTKHKKNYSISILRFIDPYKSKAQLMLLGEVFKEVFGHKNTRINQFTSEFPQEVFSYLYDLSIGTAFILENKFKDLSTKILSVEEVLNSAFEKCLERGSKKYNECFSYADSQILAHVMALSTYKNIPKPVITFSSDKHIDDAVSFIKKYSCWRHSIQNIMTRTYKK